MKRIDLINQEKSEIRFEQTTFPDSEVHIKFTEEIDHKDEYLIISRLTNANDLFILAQVCDILNRHGVQFDIRIYYLMTMRMDRVMTFNEAFSLKLCADIINSFKARKISILEAHSERSFELIERSEPLTILGLLKIPLNDKRVICYPDAGAAKRYAGFNSYTENNNAIILCKKRDLENKGKILSLDFEKKPELDEKVSNIVLRDDLCDGGRTFVGAAELLRKEYPGKKLTIVVTHLVNPIGLKNLAENFDEVVVTDSYKDWTDDALKYPNVTVLKVTEA